MLHRGKSTAVAVVAILLAAACQNPTEGDHLTTATARVSATVTGTQQPFYVHAGTLTSSGAFITGNQSFLPCGADTIYVSDLSAIPPISMTAFCGAPTLNTTGGTILDGGFVTVKYAIPGDTGSVANIEGNWTHQINFYYPTGVAAVLTAKPYAGYHVADWEISGANGSVRLVDSLTIVRQPNSTDTDYILFFEQGPGSGGTGGTGGTGSGTGGGGGTCLTSCTSPK